MTITETVKVFKKLLQIYPDLELGKYANKIYLAIESAISHLEQHSDDEEDCAKNCQEIKLLKAQLERVDEEKIEDTIVEEYKKWSSNGNDIYSLFEDMSKAIVAYIRGGK